MLGKPSLVKISILFLRIVTFLLQRQSLFFGDCKHTHVSSQTIRPYVRILMLTFTTTLNTAILKSNTDLKPLDNG